MISPRFGECTVHWFPCSESKFQTWDLPFLCFESLYHVSTRFAAKLWISFKNAKLLKSLKILLHLCRFWMSVFDIMIPHKAKEDWIYQILVDICLFHHSNILSIPFAPLHCFLFLFVMIQIIVVCYCEDAVCRVNLMKLIKIWPRFHKPTMPLLLQGKKLIFKNEDEEFTRLLPQLLWRWNRSNLSSLKISIPLKIFFLIIFSL